MGRIQFVIYDDQIFVHVDDLKNAIREKAVTVVKTANECKEGGLSLETAEMFNIATSSVIQAIDDARDEAIREIQAREN